MRLSSRVLAPLEGGRLEHVRVSYFSSSGDWGGVAVGFGAETHLLRASRRWKGMNQALEDAREVRRRGRSRSGELGCDICVWVRVEKEIGCCSPAQES